MDRSIGFSNIKVAGDLDKSTSSALEGGEVVVGSQTRFTQAPGKPGKRETHTCGLKSGYLKKGSYEGH